MTCFATSTNVLCLPAAIVCELSAVPGAATMRMRMCSPSTRIWTQASRIGAECPAVCRSTSKENFRTSGYGPSGHWYPCMWSASDARSHNDLRGSIPAIAMHSGSTQIGSVSCRPSYILTAVRDHSAAHAAAACCNDLKSLSLLSICRGLRSPRLPRCDVRKSRREPGGAGTMIRQTACNLLWSMPGSASSVG